MQIDTYVRQHHMLRHLFICAEEVHAITLVNSYLQFGGQRDGTMIC